MIQCPNCSAQIELRAVSANTSHVTTPKKVPGSETEVGIMLQSIDRQNLNPFETSFVNGTLERYEKYGDRIKMSDKQMDTLRKIAAEKSF